MNTQTDQRIAADLARVTYSRRRGRGGNITAVLLDGFQIGIIQRVTGSNSSPRGGAERNFYYAAARGQTHEESSSARYTRKEATEDILRIIHARQDAGRELTRCTRVRSVRDTSENP